jgi:hypothetical protein
MSTETAIELREGDVFDFTYSPETWERAKLGLGHGDLHWCFDGQLVVRNGRLLDTYWGGFTPYGDGRSFTLAEAQAQGTLTFVCNLDDVRLVTADELRHYDEADCFNLSHQHSCHKVYAVRKDAHRSRDRMLAELAKRIRHEQDELESATRHAARELQRLTEMRCKVEAGDLGVRLSW